MGRSRSRPMMQRLCQLGPASSDSNSCGVLLSSRISCDEDIFPTLMATSYLGASSACFVHSASSDLCPYVVHRWTTDSSSILVGQIPLDHMEHAADWFLPNEVAFHRARRHVLY